MRGIRNAARQSGRGAYSQARVFLTDTLNVLRRWWLVTYVLALVIGLTLGTFSRWFGQPWMSDLAATVLAAGLIICGVASYFFGARLVLGVAAYQALRGWISKKYRTLDPKNRKLHVLDVWYWQAFLAMWATFPLAALAILRPWEVGRVWQLLFGVFMLLHVVATSRGVGSFWRRVYATSAVAILAVMIFATVNPGDWERWKGTHQRGQSVSFNEETFQGQLTEALMPLLEEANQALIRVEIEIERHHIDGRPVPPQLLEQQARLKARRDEIKGKIETQADLVLGNPVRILLYNPSLILFGAFLIGLGAIGLIWLGKE